MVLETVMSFWKFVSKDRFPKLKDFALKMHTIFKNRNRKADSFRVAPLALVLISERCCQRSHYHRHPTGRDL